MRRRRSWAAVAAMATATAAGCGFGAGESSEGEATLTVTRDYGAERLLEASEAEPPESRTVIRMLDSAADLTTRYGGGFVHSIDGIEGTLESGRSVDWFFFVNGIESSTGAAEVAVRGGDRIWWDYRDWTDALRTPAVVGSWPEPFAQRSAQAAADPVTVECHIDGRACDEVTDRLEQAGVEAPIEASAAPGSGNAPGPRVLVGTWNRIGDDPVAALLDGGPQASGVFARFENRSLITLDAGAEPSARLGVASGLVAALRRSSEQPTWLVTGTDVEGVERAVRLLDADHLTDRYAVAASPRNELALPTQGAR